MEHNEPQKTYINTKLEQIITASSDSDIHKSVVSMNYCRVTGMFIKSTSISNVF